MNLEQLLESSLNEMGGNVFDFTTRIEQKNIEPTIKEYKRQVLSKVPYKRVVVLGSAGKKKSSGDIDLGLETDLNIDEVAKKLDIPHKKSGTQIYTSFPQYDPNGKQLDSTVQIDLMFGDADWMETGYWAPSEKESRYKGVHRNILLNSILRYASEQQTEEGKIGYAIDFGGGINKKLRFKKVMTRGPKKGEEREVSKTLEKGIIKDWGEVADFLSRNTKAQWVKEDFKKSFEELWKKTKKSFSDNVVDRIKSDLKKAFEKGDYDMPEELNEFIDRMVLELLDEESITQRYEKYSDEVENKIRNLVKELKENFSSAGGRILDSAHGEDIRVNMLDSNIDKKYIENLLKNKGYEFDIKVLQPAGKNDDVEDNLNARSGKFNTLQINFKNKLKGASLFIVLTNTRQKQFTPAKFKLNGKDIDNYNELKSLILNKINKVTTNEDIISYLKFLINTVDNKNVNYSKEIKLKKGENKIESKIKPADKQCIQNDFGEILGALVLSKATGDSIYFPKSESEPLIDYTVGLTSYSAKSKEGAAPTLVKIINNENRKDEMMNIIENSEEITEEQLTIITELFQELKKDGVEKNYLQIAKIVDKSTWDSFLKFMENNFNLNLPGDKVVEQIQSKLDGYYDNKVLAEKINQFYEDIGFNATSGVTPISQFDKRAKWRHGFITYPISSAVVKPLNNNKFNILTAFTKIINLYKDVKQINFYNDEKYLIFKIKDFSSSDIKVKFQTGGSIKSPNNQNIRFKLK